VSVPHIPVLPEEVVQSFSGVEEGYFVDCTLGYAGHSALILERYPSLKLIGIDRDREAITYSRKRLAEYGDRCSFYQGTFATRFPTLQESPVTAVLADFGVSSLQLDKKERGFGFESQALDMRMDSSASLTAYEVVNHYSRERLEYLFRTYGEIRLYKKLAAAIVEARAAAPIESAKALSLLAEKILPKGGRIHPATLMFQAIRIEVNDELAEIEGLLDALETMRPSGAIVSLITFHSLEDRLVKNRFRQWSRECICDPQAIRCTCGRDHALGKSLHRKPIVAGKDEIRENPRSRSAKLRSFRFKVRR